MQPRKLIADQSVKIKIMDMLGRPVYDNIMNLTGTSTITLDKKGYFIDILQTPKNKIYLTLK